MKTIDKVNVIGYYKESAIINKQGEENEKYLYMVVFENSIIDGKRKWLEGYNIMDGHFEIKDKAYLISCEQVTKEEYKEKTKSYFTPIEYLQ